MEQQVNESVVVELTKDKMMGVITFKPALNGGARLTLAEVKKAIADKGITTGIQEDELAKIHRMHQYNYRYIIAQGTPPTKGQEGRVELAFDPKALKDFTPRVREDGSVNLKDINIVTSVKKGDVLATRTLAIQGKEGINVLGKPVRPAKVKEARLPKGKNTNISEDGLTLTAAIDGKLEYDYNIYVDPIFTVSGDVDSSVGNIDFVGSVVVNGGVKSGFTINAGGSVEVRGPVEEATIISGGDISLTRGIAGNDKGKLIAKGNVVAKFIQNASIEAEGDVIAEVIMNSDVISGNSIRVEYGKAMIVGGSVSATNMIVSKTFGSPMGMATQLQIGITPIIYEEYQQVSLELPEKKEKIDKIEQTISYMNSKLRKAPDKKLQVNIYRLKTSLAPLQAEYEQIKARYDELNEILSMTKEGIIKCTGIMYPGVKIVWGNLMKYIDLEYTRPIIHRKDGEIYIGI